MDIATVKLACFSPTGTTKAVLQGIARGLAANAVEWIDVTRPDARRHPLRTSERDLLVVGVPVYMGRVPALLGDWLDAIVADNTPTVCVVVYGNRAYENALLELKNITRARGCVPIAGAACIGEHSFSSPGTPTAHGRPDADDLRHAEAFGRQVQAKLQSAASIADIAEVRVPGTVPYGGLTKLWDVDFIAVDDRCTHCGTCAEACPMGAIDREDGAAIDTEACITCCACIKACPQGARSMKPGPVMDAAMRLNRLYSAPKPPECFL